MESSDRGDCEFVPGREVELSEALATEYSELEVPALLEFSVAVLCLISYFLVGCDAFDAARCPRGLNVVSNSGLWHSVVHILTHSQICILSQTSGIGRTSAGLDDTLSSFPGM
jgi:hypothetical protein